MALNNQIHFPVDVGSGDDLSQNEGVVPSTFGLTKGGFRVGLGWATGCCGVELGG